MNNLLRDFGEYGPHLAQEYWTDEVLIGKVPRGLALR